MNQPLEHTTPPQARLSARLNPPSEVSIPNKIKPNIPIDKADIGDMYGYGKKFPVLQNIEDDFIRQQIPEIQIQCMFKLIIDWNLYWGFDASELILSEKDVVKAVELLSFNSYDEIMEEIQNLAGNYFGKFHEPINFSSFSDILLDGKYQDS